MLSAGEPLVKVLIPEFASRTRDSTPQLACNADRRCYVPGIPNVRSRHGDLACPPKLYRKLMCAREIKIRVISENANLSPDAKSFAPR